MPKEVEKYLRDICKAHGFDYASITYFAPSITHPGFSASVQWNFHTDDHQCASGSAATVEKAFVIAIDEADKRRNTSKEPAA